MTLTYDALGRMVEQTRSGVYTQIAYSTIGQKLALMNGQTLQKAMVPLTGKSLAVYNSGGILYYAHADMLGSIRLGTTPTSRAMYFDTAYAPFGEPYVSVGTLDPSYTGQTNDTSSYRQDTAGGLYDFPLREYSTQGRWPNPDPLGRSATCPKDPQTQNRYAYVRNNPMTYTDPTGGYQIAPCDPLDASCGGGGGCWSPDDPFCDPCELDPTLCSGPPVGGGSGGGGGGFFPGGAGSPEQPRQFPWPLLPLGFFGALDTGGSGACQGTTDCSYYKAQCAKAITPSSSAYYCLAAPAVCNSTTASPIGQKTGNCIRLQLQENDQCLNIPDLTAFTNCEARNHAFAFAFCGAACNLF